MLSSFRVIVLSWLDVSPLVPPLRASFRPTPKCDNVHTIYLSIPKPFWRFVRSLIHFRSLDLRLVRLARRHQRQHLAAGICLLDPGFDVGRDSLAIRHDDVSQELVLERGDAAFDRFELGLDD